MDYEEDLKMDKDKRNLEEDKKKPQTGPYKGEKDSKIEPTQTDIYHDTDCNIEDSNVSVPTEEAVEDAKEWVDDENRR